MSNEPIRYLSVTIGPNAGDNDTLVGVRVVPAGRNGHKVLGKTLTHGEPDSGDAITVRPGEKLLFPVGNVKVSIRDIDRESRPGLDGYAAVSNTVWTWLQFGAPPDLTLFRFLLAASRRLDTAHDLCISALDELGDRPDEPYIKTRARAFKALGYAEVMCVALNRAVMMIKDIPSEFSVSTVVPDTADAVFPALKEIRDAIEHMDDRAVGIVNALRKQHPDALSIFDQVDFLSSGVLRYTNHFLDLKEDVIPGVDLLSAIYLRRRR